MDETKQNQTEEVAALLKDLRTKISEVETLLTEARQNAKNVTSYLTAKQKAVDEKIKTIETTESSVSSASGSAATLLGQIQAKTNEAEAIQKRLNELKQKMEDPATGIESALKRISEKETEVATYAEESASTSEEIKALKDSASILDAEIKKHKEDVEGYKKEIESIYGFISGSGLSHSFSERQSGLKGDVVVWRNVTGLSVILLGSILYFIFTHPPAATVNWLELFLYKVTYSSPGIFMIWFSALQYSRAQRLLESYAFKAATAKALENYTEVLGKRFPEDQFKEKILTFVLNSMEGIYRHPNRDGLSNEESELEKHAIGNIGKTIKGFSEKVFEPLTELSEKIKNFGVK